ncbi:MAG: hypothetical protein RSC41_00625 [Oscillospiraceae bacterium]
MRYREWIILLGVSGLGMMVANWVGFSASFAESAPGVLVLLGISLISVFLDKVIPLKLPVVAYCSIVGLILASPISPVSSFVIEAAGKINFTAPLTMVGAYAGMSISSQIKQFLKQGWKMVIISVFVMTGTFIGSLVIAQIVLSLTGGI